MLLLQVPPAVPSIRLVTDPAHTEKKPVIAPGDDVVHTVEVAIQPVGKV